VQRVATAPARPAIGGRGARLRLMADPAVRFMDHRQGCCCVSASRCARGSRGSRGGPGAASMLARSVLEGTVGGWGWWRVTIAATDLLS